MAKEKIIKEETQKKNHSGCFTELFFTIFYFICIFIWFPYSPFIGLGVYFLRKHLKQKALEKAEAEEAKKKLQIKSKLSELDVDYLKAFIERIGASHFSSLSLIIPEMDETLRTDKIDVFLTFVRLMLEKTEENISKSANIEEAQNKTFLKDLQESLLVVAENLPKLKAVLEKNGVVLNYSELVDLLKIKHTEVSKAMINPSRENLYISLKRMTFMLLARAKHKKTKENIASAFAASIIALKRENPNNKTLDMMPTLLAEFLNRLLKESKVIQDDLPQDEIEDLLSKKTKEIEIDFFEAELKRGVKPTMAFPSNFNTLSGLDFEAFLDKLFRKLGYSVVKTPLTGDQGADLVVEKSGEKIVVQAKRYSGVVSNKAVQEAVAAISYYKCNRAIVVTTSTFTKSALKLAVSNKIELWDGRKLKEIINNLKESVAINDSPIEDGEIEDLLPENYKKGSLLEKLLTVRIQKGTDIQKIKTQCVFCEEEIEFSVDIKEVTTKGETSFETECPHCGNTMMVNPKPLTWKCEYCLEEFETKIEAEKHEKVCLKRKK